MACRHTIVHVGVISATSNTANSPISTAFLCIFLYDDVQLILFTTTDNMLYLSLI